MYQITLHDGTVLDELELNGNNFISEKVIDDTVFFGNLDTVTISNGETSETYNDMKLMSNRVDGGKSWFVLGEKTARKRLWSVSTLCCPLLLTVSRTFSWHLPKSTK